MATYRGRLAETFPAAIQLQPDRLADTVRWLLTSGGSFAVSHDTEPPTLWLSTYSHKQLVDAGRLLDEGGGAQGSSSRLPR
jgi:hypothetical protein